MDLISQVALPLILLGVMLFGLVSLVMLPILPGLTIMWVPALVFALVDGLHTPGSIILFILITGLMLFGSVIDNVLMGASARKTGASWVAITVSLLAGMVGSIIWPPFGGIVLALVGLFIVEVIRLRNWRQALVSTRSMAIGCGWSAVVRFLIGVVMLGLSVGWYLFAR